MPDGSIAYPRTFKYLDFHLITSPKTAIERSNNKQLFALAETIRAKYEVELAYETLNLHNPNMQYTTFLSHFDNCVKKREGKHRTSNWKSVLHQLKQYDKWNTLSSDVDEKYCEGFIDFLREQGIHSNTIILYFGVFKQAIKEAINEKLLDTNPCLLIKSPKMIEPKKEFLTLDELKKLMQIDFKKNNIKRAFLFSCLTGLRLSDVSKLKWSDISKLNGLWRITFHQQKTKGLQYYDISEQARELLGKQISTEQSFIFGKLGKNDIVNQHLKNFCGIAGIEKHITFHCARHTFAMLQLSHGTDIYTLQKLLGHSSINNTVKYLKMLDGKSRDAAKVIPKI
jgi:integrase